MEAHQAFTRGDERFVPPEQVMTRLMRREPGKSRLWLDYLILGVFMAGVLAGLLLATRG
ncbi:MAG: hypothetical protein HY334_00260 [Armatimonadetes bacterium]|nr:hypothetical protein [Armatimonadota bacterium]